MLLLDPSRRRDRTAGLLAAAYFAAVASGLIGPGLRASADAVADGRVWLLLTSALEPHPPLALAQLAVTGAVASMVIARVRARGWWAATLAGHVGSALLAYAAIGVAGALGSASALRAGARPDYGISCVLAAGLGALLAIGLARCDRVATAVGGVGVAALLPLSLGWYAVEHALAAALGAAVAWRAAG